MICPVVIGQLSEGFCWYLLLIASAIKKIHTMMNPTKSSLKNRIVCVFFLRWPGKLSVFFIQDETMCRCETLELQLCLAFLIVIFAEIDGGVSIADIAARGVCFYTGDMKPLLTPDAHHFNAAVGWFELGNRKEARVELEYVSQENQLHPLVLELRWSLDAEDKKWDAALKTAQDIIATLPNDAAGWLHCAYALRRAKSGGLDKALAFLEPAAQQFPNEPVIAFNLACYACQLNQLDDARRWLKRASEIGGEKEMRAMALADDDLKPLWEELVKC